MQSLIKFAVTRKVTILMLIAAVLLLGSVSWGRTPVDLLPDINFPAMAVIASYPGAAPEEVEQQVTRPLEGTLGTLTNIEQIQSTSSPENSMIILQFAWGTDMDAIAMDVRERLDQAGRFLPEGVGSPTLFKFDPSMLPLMGVAVGSDDLDLVALQRLGDQISQRLERVPGVASATASGGLDEEVTVIVDNHRLQTHGLTLASITNAMRVANINVPGGSVTEADSRWQIRTLVRTQTVEALEALPVGASMQLLPGQDQPVPVPIVLGDVAEVSLQAQPTTMINRLNGQPNISISLNKRSDANTVVTANQVRAELDRLADDYPQLTFTPVNDQSQFIQLSIDSIISSAAIGGLLALVVLLLFLRSIRSTLIIAISIPVSVVSTFILMYFAGLTINMMTLSGLALGLGMLVDSSIVVIENIYRHLDQGDSPREAAFNGAKDVAMAITASTLTTVAVFLPVVFVGGIAGMLFRELALTVSFSLLASLVVALTVIPMLSATFARRLQPVKARVDIAPYYRRALAWALGRRVLVLALTALIFIGSLAMVPRLGGEFMPSFDEGTGAVSVELPADATLEETLAAAAQVEEVLLAQPDVELVSTAVGGSAARGMAAMMGFGAGGNQANLANISFQLVPIEDRDRSTTQFLKDLDNELPRLPDAAINVRQQRSAMGGGMMGGGSIDIEITGDDLNRLGEYAQDLQSRLNELTYVAEASSSISRQNPEVHVLVDLDRSSMLGINPAMVGSAIRSAFQGDTATRISSDGYELAVVVRLQDEQRDSIEDISRVILSAQGGRVIRVDDVASVETAYGPRSINRRDNQRYVTVSAELAEGRDLLSAQRNIQGILDDMHLASGYQIGFRGQIMEMQDAFGGLLLALALAIALVYMVMASQFESLIHPFTVMFTLPLAAVGVVLVLLITGLNLSIVSLIGIVVLAGIVVNNAIVLVDYVNQLRGRGMDLDEALLEAGQIRLRPIIMTTLTTILAMVPLAVRTGSGMEMQQPLAYTVIGGLAVGAILTLFIIPLIYKTFERLLPKATIIVNQD